MDAWRIPGVASFAFCLFFSKLIAYTFLYWLPYYIKSTRIEGRHLSPKESGDLSVRGAPAALQAAAAAVVHGAGGRAGGQRRAGRQAGFGQQPGSRDLSPL
jgi:hypothetical protein